MSIKFKYLNTLKPRMKATVYVPQKIVEEYTSQERKLPVRAWAKKIIKEAWEREKTTRNE